MLRVNTIYPAFMGEVNVHGIGAPCTFLRLAGCNLRCYYKTKHTLCDTPEALEVSCGKEMSVSDILAELQKLGNQIVCLTGGEPLLQDCTELLTTLSVNGYNVVVETNGSQSIRPYRHIHGVSFVVDVKSPSTGENSKMLEENYSLMRRGDFVKFVVDTKEDVKSLFTWWENHRNGFRGRVGVGLFWGTTGYQALLEDIKGYGFYINMQTHKMMCLYDSVEYQKDFENIKIPRNL